MIARDLAPLDVLEHEHALGDVRPDHARNDEQLVALDKPARSARCCAPPRRSRAPRGGAPRAHPRAPRSAAAAPSPSGRAISAAVERSTARSTSTCSTIPGRRTLTTTSPAALQQRAMRLRDRRCRQRLGIDAREHVVAEVRADDRVDVGERHGRHLVDEPAQLLDVDVGQQVGPRREQLAELDVRRAELLEASRNVARALTRRLSIARGRRSPPRTRRMPAALRDPRRPSTRDELARGVRPRRRVMTPLAAEETPRRQKGSEGSRSAAENCGRMLDSRREDLRRRALRRSGGGGISTQTDPPPSRSRRRSYHRDGRQPEVESQEGERSQQIHQPCLSHVFHLLLSPRT